MTKFIPFCVIFFLGVTSLSLPLTHGAFIDTKEDSLLYFQEKHIFEGYPDGYFHGEWNINRAELMKILVEAKNMSHMNYTPSCFSDIEEGLWYEKYICIGKALQMTEGYPDGTFRPGNKVTKAEALKMIIGTLSPEEISTRDSLIEENKRDHERIKEHYRALQETLPEEAKQNPTLQFTDLQESDWSTPYILQGWRRGLIKSEPYAHPHTEIQRKEVAEILFRSILNERMPFYSYCAQSFTLHSCARDFFRIEKHLSTLPLDTLEKVQTGSGNTLYVTNSTPRIDALMTELEAYRLFFMEHEFSPEHIIALIKIDSEGSRSHTWWKEYPIHHGNIIPKILTTKEGNIIVEISHSTSANTTTTGRYLINEKNLHRELLTKEY